MAKSTHLAMVALLILAGSSVQATAHAQSKTSIPVAAEAAVDQHYAHPNEVREFRESQMAALTKNLTGEPIPNLASTTGGGSLSCVDEGECLIIELVSVLTSPSSGPTYTFKITATCTKGLSNVFFLLPGVAPSSWSSTAPLDDVEVDSKMGIHYIKFEFGGDIKNGDEIEVSYTLPSGYGHTTAILGAAKTARTTDGFGLSANDCGPTEPPCVVYSKSDLRAAGTHIVGGDATIVIPSDACELVISVSSYELPGGSVRPFEDQILFDNVTDTYGPGTHYVSVDIPDCAWQSDVYLGEVVEHLTAGVGHPPDRIIAWDYLEDEGLACVCVADPPSFDGQLIKDGSRRLIEVNAPGGVTEVEFYNTKNLIVAGTDGLAGFDRVGDTFTWNLSAGTPPTTVRFELEPADPSNSNVQFFIKITDRCDQVVDVDPMMELRDTDAVAHDFALYPAYPNPFNPQTQIRFHLPEGANVSLVVYDLMGREVTTLLSGFVADGAHDVTWNGRSASGDDVASGVYLYRLDAGRFSKTMRVTLLK